MNTITNKEREKIYAHAQALVIAAGGPDVLTPTGDDQIEAELRAKFGISADRAGTARAHGQMRERGRLRRVKALRLSGPII